MDPSKSHHLLTCVEKDVVIVGSRLLCCLWVEYQNVSNFVSSCLYPHNIACLPRLFKLIQNFQETMFCH